MRDEVVTKLTSFPKLSDLRDKKVIEMIEKRTVLVDTKVC